MMKSNKVEIYNRIAQEGFDDSIIFKHRRHKKPIDMTTSINSLSSTSSDEHDGNISKPTIMNLSTVSIFPDLRSPDSILNDIEQKERILADVLSFDKIKINPENLKQYECSTSTSQVQDDLTNKGNELSEKVCTNICFTPTAPETESNVSLDKSKNSNNLENSCLKLANGNKVELPDTAQLETPGKFVVY